MTNVEALKACYIAIGGNAADVADVKTTAKVIEKISEIATPGGGGGGDVTLISISNPVFDVDVPNITYTLNITPRQLIALEGAAFINGELNQYYYDYDTSQWVLDTAHKIVAWSPELSYYDDGDGMVYRIDLTSAVGESFVSNDLDDKFTLVFS